MQRATLLVQFARYSRIGLLLCAANARLGAQSPVEALRDRIVARVAQVPGAFAGVYYHDLGSGERMALNADSLLHAASTMKVPVMIEYFRAIDDRRLARGETTVLQNRFASIVDGSAYTLDGPGL